MNWWLIVGVLLIAVVGAVLYLFFVVRPRSTSQVTAAVQLLVNQTHGRRPDVLVPATCVATTAPHKADLAGLGAMAITDQGVLFAAVDPDRVLVIPRADLVSAMVSTSANTENGPVSKVLPMLVLQWRHAGDPVDAAFTVPDPDGLARTLAPSTP